MSVSPLPTPLIMFSHNTDETNTSSSKERYLAVRALSCKESVRLVQNHNKSLVQLPVVKITRVFVLQPGIFYEIGGYLGEDGNFPTQQ